jgi:hypothetical protein
MERSMKIAAGDAREAGDVDKGGDVHERGDMDEGGDVDTGDRHQKGGDSSSIPRRRNPVRPMLKPPVRAMLNRSRRVGIDPSSSNPCSRATAMTVGAADEPLHEPKPTPPTTPEWPADACS